MYLYCVHALHGVHNFHVFIIPKIFEQSINIIFFRVNDVDWKLELNSNRVSIVFNYQNYKDSNIHLALFTPMDLM